MNFLQSHLWGIKKIITKAMAHGMKHEPDAKKQYSEEQRKIDPTAVEECGEQGQEMKTWIS